MKPWIGILFLLISATLWGSEKFDDPKVGELLNKMMTVIGDKSVIEKLENIKTVSSTEMQGMGMKMEITTISAKNKAKLSTTMNGKVMMEQGFDGEEAWSKDMMMGTRVLKGAEALAVMQTTLENTLDATGFFEKIRLGKDKVFGGEEVHVLLCDKEGMETSELYIGKEDYLLKGMLATQESIQGKVKSEIYCEEYKTSKLGMKYVSKQTVKMGPISMSVLVTSYEENAKLDPAVFKKP